MVGIPKRSPSTVTAASSPASVRAPVAARTELHSLRSPTSPAPASVTAAAPPAIRETEALNRRIISSLRCRSRFQMMPGRQRRDRALREWYKASVRVDGRWLWVAWDAWRVSHGAVAAVEDRQRRRLADLIAFARTRSAFYCALYGQLPDAVAAM